MRVIYVAGRYSAPTEAQVKENIAIAEKYAQKIWKAGHAAICPHLNTAHWGNLLTHDQFIAGDLEIIKRCDAVYLIPGWEHSKGARQENAFAVNRRIPTFNTMTTLLAWCGSDDQFCGIVADNQPDWETQATDEEGRVVVDCPHDTTREQRLDGLVATIRYDDRDFELSDEAKEVMMNHDRNAAHAQCIADGSGFVTKDSGTRHVEVTGGQRDSNAGKGRFDLIPALPLKRLAQLYQRGAEKYGPNNWRLGINLPRYIDSAMRHINDFQSGERTEDHLIAAAWNLFSYVWTEQEVKEGRLPQCLETGEVA